MISGEGMQNDNKPRDIIDRYYFWDGGVITLLNQFKVFFSGFRAIL
jgi:hypothetical protein